MIKCSKTKCALFLAGCVFVRKRADTHFGFLKLAYAVSAWTFDGEALLET